MGRSYAALTGLALAGCSSLPSSDHWVFDWDDTRFEVGRPVTACGVNRYGLLYREGANEYPNNSITLLPLTSGELVGNGPVCVTGTLVWLGCNRGGEICLDSWVSDYAIRPTYAWEGTERLT